MAPGNAARLMYFQAEEGLIYALEVPAWKFALVVGEVRKYSPVSVAANLRPGGRSPVHPGAQLLLRQQRRLRPGHLRHGVRHPLHSALSLSPSPPLCRHVTPTASVVLVYMARDLLIAGNDGSH